MAELVLCPQTPVYLLILGLVVVADEARIGCYSIAFLDKELS
jgi:hypothetical protein